MMRRRSLLAAAALALALACASGPVAVSALHEDQVGSFDWHHQYVGQATQAAFAGTKNNKRTFVSTEQGAIAALSFKSGEIGASRGVARQLLNAISILFHTHLNHNIRVVPMFC
jgi:hypothetical protein